MPAELTGLWPVHVKPMTDMWFATARETLHELPDSTKHLGARPGIGATLYTWSQTLA